MIDESAAVGEVGTDNLNVNKIITIIITIIVGIGGIIMGYIFGRSMAPLNTYTIYLSRNMTYTVVETLTRVYKEYIERPLTYTITTVQRETVTTTRTEQHVFTHVISLTVTEETPPKTITVTETYVTPLTLVELITYTKTVTSTVTYTPISPPSDIFRILTSRVVVKDSIPYIHITFTTTITNVIIDLIGPDGVKIHTAYPLSEETGTYLKMSTSSTTPMKGSYRIIAWKEDSLGKIKKINETVVTFSGYDIKISTINFKKSWNEVTGHTIDRIDMNLINVGDLPTFLKEVRVHIPNINIFARISIPNEVLWPSNKEIYVSISTIIYLIKIPEGTHQLKIDLVNDLNEIVATYTTSITFP